MPQIYDMGQPALLPLRRKAGWEFLCPLKIRRLRPGLNPRTWGLKASTLPLDHRSRYSLHTVQKCNTLETCFYDFYKTFLLLYCTCIVYCTRGIYLVVYFPCGAAAKRGLWPSHSWVFYSAQNEAPKSVGLFWTYDQLVAETSTWQYTALTRNRHPCPRRNTKPQSQQASGRRPKP
jgi:hypothetical protein